MAGDLQLGPVKATALVSWTLHVSMIWQTKTIQINIEHLVNTCACLQLRIPSGGKSTVHAAYPPIATLNLSHYVMHLMASVDAFTAAGNSPE